MGKKLGKNNFFVFSLHSYTTFFASIFSKVLVATETNSSTIYILERETFSGAELAVRD